jgi:hypothetical protein
MPGKYIKPTVVAAGTLFVGRVPFGWVVGSVDGAWGHNALVRPHIRPRLRLGPPGAAEYEHDLYGCCDRASNDCPTRLSSPFQAGSFLLGEEPSAGPPPPKPLRFMIDPTATESSVQAENGS